MGHLVRIAVATALIASVVTSAGGALSQATPTSADSAGGLAEMLALLPAQPLDASYVTYADIAGQRSAVGVAVRPTSEAERGQWTAATQGLAFTSDSPRMAGGDWREVFGFDLFDVDQAIEIAAPPDIVTIYRGRLDETALHRAWDREGYQPVVFEGTTYFSVAGDFEQDLTSDRGRLALSHLNKIALIDGEYLAASSTQQGIEGIIQTYAGTRPSMADDVSIAPVTRNMPPDLVSALIVSGSLLIGGFDPVSILDLGGTPGPTDVDAIATQIAEAEAEARRMPPVVTGLLGMTAGGSATSPEGATPSASPADQSTARLVAAVTTTSPAAAETAAEVIADRLANQAPPNDDSGRSYADLFPERTVLAVTDEPVVIAELAPGPDVPRSILINLLFSRSLTFLAWSL